MADTNTKIDLRTMTREDLPPVLELINKEGWEYEMIDVERILNIDPDDSIVAVAGDEIVGAISVTCHANRGILGHVLVKDGWRKAGIGKNMMAEVLKRLDASDIEIIELYSVPEAVEFYKKLGFRKISDMKIYRGNLKNRDVGVRSKLVLRELTESDLPDVIEMDKRISGFDRSNVIEELMLPFLNSCIGLFEEGKLSGFALGRSADIEAEIGPWIMEKPNREDGMALIIATIKSLDNMKAFIYPPCENPLAISIVQNLDLEMKHLVHRFVRTKLDVQQFGPGVMGYSALEFG